MAQSVGYSTLDLGSGRDSRVVGSSPESGSVLRWSLLGIISLSLSTWPSPPLSVFLSFFFKECFKIELFEKIKLICLITEYLVYSGKMSLSDLFFQMFSPSQLLAFVTT